MSRALLLGLLVFALLLLGLAFLDGRFFLLLMPLLVYVGAALLQMPDTIPVHVYRNLQSLALQEGNSTVMYLDLINEGAAISVLEVRDQVPGGLHIVEGFTGLVTALPSGGSAQLAYALKAARGAYEFQSVAVTVSETLGLFQRTAWLPAHARLIVMPRARRLRPLPIRPRRTLGFAGPIPSRQSGVGVDFYGVREYQPGDPLRRVNWHVMARRPDRPHTTEFEQERIADVGLILDVRRQIALEIRGVSLLEHGVHATAALAESLLHDGHRVGLLLYGRGIEWVFPGYGRLQRERILRALASAGPGDSQVFASLDFFPARLFPPRSQMIFISPLLGEDHQMLFRLQAQGYAVFVVSPDPVSFEVAYLSSDPLLPVATRMAQLERRLLLQQLRQKGIAVADWPVHQSLDDSIHAAMTSAWRARSLIGSR
ncbi:MAG: DUF58 domain-containing protein [Anaerolineae bacterium]|nr:DUF58 domain-containing protein [Anaerolineae bacterium]